MIVIRETDNTQSPVREYTNFTVLVPGYAADADDKGFGGELAIEFTSQADFVKKIGKVAASEEVIPAVACKLTKLSFRTTEEGEDAPRTLVEGKTYYQRSENPTPTATEGYLVGLEDGTKYTYTKFTADGIGNVTESDRIRLIEDDDAGYWYAPGAFNGNKEGTNAVTSQSFGNQYAYELLGLGYTVLYADLATLESLYAADKEHLFKDFKDKAAYDFRYILTGFVNGTYNTAAYNLAGERQDCTALCDIRIDVYTSEQAPPTVAAKVTAIRDEAEAQGTALGKNGKYVALFANRPTYKMTPDQDYNNNVTFAAGFHYLACAAKALENFAEWYAVAGYTRGVSPYAIDKLDVNLGDAAVEVLQGRNSYGNKSSRCVNILVKVRGQYYLWGNRTAELLTADATNEEQDTLKASHFLNIRQLCTTIKKQLYVSCRSLTFDPNSDVLWLNFKGRITPTLDRAKGDQGLDDYKISKVIDGRKAALTAKIRVVPIEAVEDFFLDLILEDSISGEIEINESED